MPVQFDGTRGPSMLCEQSIHRLRNGLLIFVQFKVHGSALFLRQFKEAGGNQVELHLCRTHGNTRGHGHTEVGIGE